MNVSVLKDCSNILTEMSNSIQSFFKEYRARSNMLHANDQHYCSGYSTGESDCKE